MNSEETYPQLKISDLYKLIDQAEGWLTQLEQTALLHLPALVDHLEGDIVEIGSFKGKSTIALGLGSKWISKRKRQIYAVDPFTDSSMYHGNYYVQFLYNIQSVQLNNYALPIKSYSHLAITQCPALFSALFVDGDHSYNGVKLDIQLYTPRVVPGGLIAFHDYSTYPDVRKAVDELCDSKKYVYVCDYDSLRLIRKLD